MFNNREIATAIWLTIFAIWALTRAGVRKSIANVIRAFLHWKIVTCIAAMTIYVTAIVALLSVAGFWRPEMIKDTLLWFSFTAFAMVMRFATSRDSVNIFWQVCRDNIKLVIFLEFLIGTYVLPLPAELVLVPFVTFIVLLDAVARLKEEHASVAKFTGCLLAVIGFAIIAFSASHAIADYRSVGTLDTIRSIVFPPFMSIALVPFIYFLILISTYEQIFLRLTLGRKKPTSLVRYAKRRIIWHHGLSLRRLKTFAGRPPFEIMQIEATEDVDWLLREGNPQEAG